MPAIALSFVNVTKRYGARAILDGLNLGLMQGEKVGLIGRNGAGKTTLFKLLAGEDHPDGGEVIVTGGQSIARLSQEPVFQSGMTVRDALESAVADHQALLDRHGAIHDELTSVTGSEADKLHTELEAVEHRLHDWGWDLAPRVEEAASFWGLNDLDALVESLSGGWRKRVALAQAWLRRPDVLVLDEPTNHLDPDQVERLQAWLLAFPGALLLITHDRQLLDAVVDRMVELENGKAISYEGGYSDYLLLKADQDFRESRLTDHMQNRLRAELAWLRRGAKARTRKSKLRIEEVLDLKDEVGDRTRTASKQALTFQRGDNRSDALLNGSEMRFAYPGGAELLDGLDLVLQRHMRIAMLGPNGCGKSTLLKILLGELEPTGGELTRHPKLKITTLSQGRGELDGRRDLLWNLCEGSPTVALGDSIMPSQVYLMRFGFPVPDQKRDTASLSGGERNRLLLAKAMLNPADLLVLDEPTNDLDIPTLQNLEEALCGFPGTLLLVSHDRFFLDQVATHTLAWNAGTPRWELYEGNPTTVRDLRAARAAEAAPASGVGLQASGSKSSASAKSKKPGLTQKEQRRLSELETAMAALHTRITVLDTLLADPASFLTPEAPGHQAIKDRDTAKTQLDTLEHEWLELEEKRAEA